MRTYTYKHKFGKRLQCAIHSPASKRQHMKTRYYFVLNECKKIFDKHFIGKVVGYEKLKEDLGKVFDDHNEAPLFYVTSKNLARSKHLDTEDYTRSYTFWVSRHEHNGAFLLFPQWGLAIELSNERYISWHVNECAHCSSVSKTSDDGEKIDLFSLFTALPKSLYIAS